MHIISEQLIAPIATFYMIQRYKHNTSKWSQKLQFSDRLKNRKLRKTRFFSHFGYYWKMNIYAQQSLFLEQVIFNEEVWMTCTYRCSNEWVLCYVDVASVVSSPSKCCVRHSEIFECKWSSVNDCAYMCVVVSKYVTRYEKRDHLG